MTAQVSNEREFSGRARHDGNETDSPTDLRGTRTQNGHVEVRITGVLQEHLHKRLDSSARAERRPVVRQRKNHFKRRHFLVFFSRLNVQLSSSPWPTESVSLRR